MFGGARRDRTADLLNAIQALSQLSYGPETWVVLSSEAVLGMFGSGCLDVFVFVVNIYNDLTEAIIAIIVVQVVAIVDQ